MRGTISHFQEKITAQGSKKLSWIGGVPIVDRKNRDWSAILCQPLIGVGVGVGVGVGRKPSADSYQSETKSDDEFRLQNEL